MKITMSSPIAILLFILFSGGTTTAFVTPRHYQHNNDNYYYLNPQQRTHNSFSSAFVITSNHKVLLTQNAQTICSAKEKLTDKEIEKKIGLCRADHENRNISNELPNSKIKPSPQDPAIWLDDDGQQWKLNAEQNAARQGIGFQSSSVQTRIVVCIRRYVPTPLPALCEYHQPSSIATHKECAQYKAA